MSFVRLSFIPTLCVVAACNAGDMAPFYIAATDGSHDVSALDAGALTEMTDASVTDAKSPHVDPSAPAPRPELGAAEEFAVWAGTEVVDMGNNQVVGRLGEASSVDDAGAETDDATQGVTGPQVAHAIAATYAQLEQATCNRFRGDPELGRLTLTPGVYCMSDVMLSNDLVLDAQGNDNAVFVFQVSGSLTTESGVRVQIINCVKPGNVYWQVGASVQIADENVFVGNILAFDNIGLGANTSLAGRAFALQGVVVMNRNRISTGILPAVVAPDAGF